MKNMLMTTAITMMLVLSAGCTTDEKATAGTVGGAVAGGLLGSAVTGGSAGGAIIGAAGGAVVGNQVGKNWN